MGVETAAFVGPLLEAELAAGFAAEMAAGGIFGIEAAGLGFTDALGGGIMDAAGIGAGVGDFAIGAGDVYNFAGDLGLSPDEYVQAYNEMGGSETVSTNGFGDTLTPEVQGTQQNAYPDDIGNDLTNLDGSTWQPSQMMDQPPAATLDSQSSLYSGGNTMTGSTQGVGADGSGLAQFGESSWAPGQTPGARGMSLRDIMKTPQYQIGKTGIDLYSQFQDSQAAKAGLNRFNQLNDRGAWANQAGQDLYTNPNAFFNSPAFKQSQAGAMEGYRRQQAARGRRADTAGLALQMQKYGTDQFNNYSSGLARFNQQPNMSGLQGLYQGAGRAQSNMFNTLANKDLWDSMG